MLVGVVLAAVLALVGAWRAVRALSAEMDLVRGSWLEKQTRDMEALGPAVVAWSIAHGGRLPASSAEPELALDAAQRLDPWGRAYLVEEAAFGYRFRVRSLGEDGEAGSSDRSRRFERPVVLRVEEQPGSAPRFGLGERESADLEELLAWLGSARPAPQARTKLTVAHAGAEPSALARASAERLRAFGFEAVHFVPLAR